MKTPTFDMTFETANAAFGDGARHHETARILREVADMIANNYTDEGNIRDGNGNTIGGFAFNDPHEAYR